MTLTPRESEGELAAQLDGLTFSDDHKTVLAHGGPFRSTTRAERALLAEVERLREAASEAACLLADVGTDEHVNPPTAEAMQRVRTCGFPVVVRDGRPLSVIDRSFVAERDGLRAELERLRAAAQRIYDRHADYYPLGSWKRPGHDVIQREWDDLRDALIGTRNEEESADDA